MIHFDRTNEQTYNPFAVHAQFPFSDRSVEEGREADEIEGPDDMDTWAGDGIMYDIGRAESPRS